MNWNNLKQYVLDRAAERSTWLGVTGLLTSVGATAVAHYAEIISAIGVTIASLILAATKDKS